MPLRLVVRQACLARLEGRDEREVIGRVEPVRPVRVQRRPDDHVDHFRERRELGDTPLDLRYVAGAAEPEPGDVLDAGGVDHEAPPAGASPVRIWMLFTRVISRYPSIPLNRILDSEKSMLSGAEPGRTRP